MYWEHPQLRDCLLELTTKCRLGDVVIRGESEEHGPAEWLQILNNKELNARLKGYEAGPHGEWITAEVRSLFSTRILRFSIHWSAEREGWAFPNGAGRTVHYFVAKHRVSDPPYCGAGMLVSLCKRSFLSNSGPFVTDPKYAVCKTCTERFHEMYSEHVVDGQSHKDTT